MRPILIAVIASLALVTPTFAAMDCSKDMKAAEDAAAKAPKDIAATVTKLLADATSMMKAGDMGRCSELLGQAYDKLGMKKN